MAVDPADEEAVRHAAYQVNKLWSTWRDRYSDKTSEEVLALVAFQFARHYVGTAMAGNRFEKEAADIEQALDGVLDSLGR